MTELEKLIPLTKGQYAIVDKEDFIVLNQSKWSYLNGKGKGYAVRNQKHRGGKAELMHRIITGAASDKEVDHINGNGLDNRRANLRICTHTQNMHNSRKYQNGSSKYKGVYFDSKGYWSARIYHNKHQYHIGSFKVERYAAMAYDLWAKDLRGEYAWLNFPDALHSHAAINKLKEQS